MLDESRVRLSLDHNLRQPPVATDLSLAGYSQFVLELVRVEPRSLLVEFRDSLAASRLGASHLLGGALVGLSGTYMISQLLKGMRLLRMLICLFG